MTALRLRYEMCCDDIEVAYLGEVEIGRTNTGKRNTPGYMFRLAEFYTGWRRTKSHLAARNALESDLRDWLRKAGLT